MLDTNVLSELMRPAPSAKVETWLGRLDLDGVHMTSVTQAEIFVGIALLPQGRRRNILNQAAIKILSQYFQGRTPVFDMMIAAIARAHGAALATRNTRHFEGCEVVLHDPWTG